MISILTGHKKKVNYSHSLVEKPSSLQSASVTTSSTQWSPKNDAILNANLTLLSESPIRETNHDETIRKALSRIEKNSDNPKSKVIENSLRRALEENKNASIATMECEKMMIKIFRPNDAAKRKSDSDDSDWKQRKKPNLNGTLPDQLMTYKKATQDIANKSFSGFEVVDSDEEDDAVISSQYDLFDLPKNRKFNYKVEEYKPSDVKIEKRNSGSSEEKSFDKNIRFASTSNLSCEPTKSSAKDEFLFKKPKTVDKQMEVRLAEKPVTEFDFGTQLNFGSSTQTDQNVGILTTQSNMVEYSHRGANINIESKMEKGDNSGCTQVMLNISKIFEQTSTTACDRPNMLGFAESPRVSFRNSRKDDNFPATYKAVVLDATTNTSPIKEQPQPACTTIDVGTQTERISRSRDINLPGSCAYTYCPNIEYEQDLVLKWGQHFEEKHAKIQTILVDLQRTQ
jgi:hypothetical protein